MDEELVVHFQKKLNNAECRILGLGEKKKRKANARVSGTTEVKTLVDFM
jgi:hypothetical protein